MLHFPKWKTFLILLICFAGIFYALPSLFRSEHPLTSWLPEVRVNLGLDLQGGSHLLLEVDETAFFRDRYASIMDDLRGAMRKEKLGYTSLVSNARGIELTLLNKDDSAKLKSMLRSVDPNLEAEDGAPIRIHLNEYAQKEAESHLLEQSIEIVQRRIDESGTKELSLQRQGSSRILLQVPGVEDPGQLKRLLGKTAKLTFHMVGEDTGSAALPANFMRLPYEESGGSIVVERRPLLGGDRLTAASTSFDQANSAVVNFRFDNIGAKRFGDITKANVGKPFAIVLDNKVISAPTIREPIMGGSGQISGNFTVESANELALLLRAGALPAPLKILEERSVGPSLGADSIRAGTMASIVGVALVMGFMVLNYGIFGVMANLALLVNLGLLLSVMALIGATLTLPGIAGIVLTMGMAVDANVLIFERIREEIRNGKSPVNAGETGFKRAYGTIIDSHVTSLVAALILYYVGTGPVRGFAVTLGLGLLASLFTSVTFCRLMFASWIRKKRPIALPI